MSPARASFLICHSVALRSWRARAGNTHEKDDWEDEERRARERSEMGRDSAQPDAADFARRAAMNDI